MEYFGVVKTLSILQKYFHWPYMRKDVECLVKRCGVCHRIKFKINAYDLYTPLLISNHQINLCIDFVFGLPRSR